MAEFFQENLEDVQIGPVVIDNQDARRREKRAHGVCLLYQEMASRPGMGGASFHHREIGEEGEKRPEIGISADVMTVSLYLAWVRQKRSPEEQPP